MICTALTHNLRTSHADDRISVPTLEIIAFLFHVGLFQQSEGVNLASLCLYTQKAGYKTGNVRKIMACVRVYGGVAGLQKDTARTTGVQEARRRLGALMYHPWPRVRSLVVDEIWGLSGFEAVDEAKLTGVDWSEAGKTQIKAAVQGLGMD
jgi:hypothetical protein